MVAPLDFSTLSAVSTPTLHLLVLPMNRHTFQDAVKSRREALANEIEDDDDDDDDDALPMRGENHSVEGEEDDGQEKVISLLLLDLMSPIFPLVSLFPPS